ncbi:MAG: hypothetical protein KDK91_03010 [Gammaproteobacteria bacterium]|nr:hypothetical protein [Gammaproteobacteria bacterium]
MFDLATPQGRRTNALIMALTVISVLLAMVATVASLPEIPLGSWCNALSSRSACSSPSSTAYPVRRQVSVEIHVGLLRNRRSADPASAAAWSGQYGGPAVAQRAAFELLRFMGAGTISLKVARMLGSDTSAPPTEAGTVCQHCGASLEVDSRSRFRGLRRQARASRAGRNPVPMRSAMARITRLAAAGAAIVTKLKCP